MANGSNVENSKCPGAALHTFSPDLEARCGAYKGNVKTVKTSNADIVTQDEIPTERKLYARTIPRDTSIANYIYI